MNLQKRCNHVDVVYLTCERVLLYWSVVQYNNAQKLFVPESKVFQSDGGLKRGNITKIDLFPKTFSV